MDRKMSQEQEPTSSEPSLSGAIDEEQALAMIESYESSKKANVVKTSEYRKAVEACINSPRGVFLLPKPLTNGAIVQFHKTIGKDPAYKNKVSLRTVGKTKQGGKTLFTVMLIHKARESTANLVKSTKPAL